jgi:hypothetical protein
MSRLFAFAAAAMRSTRAPASPNCANSLRAAARMRDFVALESYPVMDDRKCATDSRIAERALRASCDAGQAALDRISLFMREKLS